jgi:hypothetical protein
MNSQLDLNLFYNTTSLSGNELRQREMRLANAMQRGQVKFHKENPDTKLGRVKISYKDIQKLLNNPGR